MYMKEDDELRLRLYSLLLRKYADLVNEKEKRTVGEIKALVNSDDLTVQSILVDLKPENYSFEKYFLESAKKAFEFIQKETSFVKPGIKINYWLSPKEILEGKVADDEDLAVFLCSLLTALEDKNCFVVIAELEDLTNHAFVITEFNNKFIILDPSQEDSFNKFTGKKEEVLKNYSFNNSKIKHFLYKFNSQEYKQFI